MRCAVMVSKECLADGLRLLRRFHEKVRVTERGIVIVMHAGDERKKLEKKDLITAFVCTFVITGRDSW